LPRRSQNPIPGREFAIIDVEICASATVAGPSDDVWFALQMADNSVIKGNLVGQIEPKLGLGTVPAGGGCKRGLVTFEAPIGQRPLFVVWDHPGSGAVKWSL
jgi:hypothetical protein